MNIRVPLYSAAFSGALCFMIFAGPALADSEDPSVGAIAEGMPGDISLGADIYSDVYSQVVQNTIPGGTTFLPPGAIAEGMPGDLFLGGDIYSDVYSQVTQITIPGGTTFSPPPSQGCAGTAPNCTDDVTNTPTISDPPFTQSADLSAIGATPTASADPIPEPASLALLASALLWLGLARRRRNRV